MGDCGWLSSSMQSVHPGLQEGAGGSSQTESLVAKDPARPQRKVMYTQYSTVEVRTHY